MTFRIPTLAALVLAFAADQVAVAQPIAPPRRPTFTSYNSIFSPSGGYYGYGGLGYGYSSGYGAQAAQQNLLIQQQLNATNQNIANLQTFITSGVNPNLPATGRGAVSNQLGHWYQPRNFRTGPGIDTTSSLSRLGGGGGGGASAPQTPSMAIPAKSTKR